MKKHIIGLIIFSFVLSMAVLVESFFTAKTENLYAEKAKNSCWRMKKTNIETAEPQFVQTGKSLIEQATLDLSTRKMNWRMNIDRKSSLVALNFFVANESGTNYVATELAPSGFMNKSLNSTAGLEFTSSYLWLDKLDAPQNLYVIPQTISMADYRAKNFDVNFNRENATSVLIYASGR